MILITSGQMKRRNNFMRENPCRYCALHIRYKNHYGHGRSNECYVCQNLKLHKEYLKTQRKYEVGESITNIQDLLKETWVMCHGRTKHIEIFKSMPLRVVMGFLNSGSIKKAIPREPLANKVNDI